MLAFRKNKSYYLKFLYSYLLVLIVPFVTIFITYFSAEVSIRNEILSSSENSLHQFFSHVDTRLSEMVHTSFQMMQNKLVTKRAYELKTSQPENGYETYQIREYLSGLPRDTFSDVFLYYYLSDSIVSANNSSLSSEYYSSAYYETGTDSLQSADDFRSRLRLDKGNTPYLISLGGPLTSPNLAVAMAQNPGYPLGVPEMTACVVLQPYLLEEMLQSANSHSEGIILIYDAEGNPLAASRSFSSALDLSQYSDGEARKSLIDGAEYMVQVFESQVLDCTYVSLTPTAIFWERLNVLRGICMASMVLCMTLSAAVMIFLSRRNYSPITSLLRKIRTETNHTYDSNEQNELDFISSILQQSLIEKNMLEAKVETESQALQGDFLLRALQGTWIPSGEDEDDFLSYRICLLSDLFAVILIRIEDYNEIAVGKHEEPETHKLLTVILSNVFLELCGQSHQGFLLELGPSYYAGIINFRRAHPDDLTQDVRSICTKYFDFMETNFGIVCTCGISDIQCGLSGLHQGYLHAKKALEYRFAYGQGRKIFYAEIKGRAFHYHYSADSKAAQILLQYIQQDSAENCKQIIEKVCDCFQLNSDSSFETFQCFKFDIMNIISKISRQTSSISAEEERIWLQELLQADTLVHYLRALEEILEKLQERHSVIGETSSICNQTAAYIDQNYQDASLNMNALGGIMKISPSYLSKLFKAQFGIPPLDYLYQVRIKAAKEYLQDSQMTMENIAQKTGFINGPALIKIFRKFEGITPGAYRKLIRDIERNSSENEMES